ncbi:unnamed protein product [Nippostrongylus brasiliensis]|uniref:Retrotransposon hot spot (RHS) protein n=1 Tax=Nippostrongylus brasiliensis TaxID=27835 RepID=A0A158QYY2_NIPBR|nr:unnamed protein product [Nippostrongylus brasiliensis]
MPPVRGSSEVDVVEVIRRILMPPVSGPPPAAVAAGVASGDGARRPKIQFVGKVVGETDHFKRYGNVENAVWLEKAGMKEFTALFMTLPVYHMDRIAKTACAKHEKQLTCGAEYEGVETTKKRINDLRKIGNHKMMFDSECGDAGFVGRVYPCIGRNVSTWIRPCAEPVNEYSVVRDSVNQRIATVYDAAVQRIKQHKDKDNKSDLRLFEKTMSSIAHLEGSKCGLFKQMRVCVLRRLLERCGVEAMKSFNTSISLGYLRTERRERLNLDFEVFNYPVHPNCIGL